MIPIEDSSRLRNDPPPHSFVDRTVTAIPTEHRWYSISTNAVRRNDAARNEGVARIDMKLEVVGIPVSDIDRSSGNFAMRSLTDFELRRTSRLTPRNVRIFVGPFDLDCELVPRCLGYLMMNASAMQRFARSAAGCRHRPT